MQVHLRQGQHGPHSHTRHAVTRVPPRPARPLVRSERPHVDVSPPGHHPVLRHPHTGECHNWTGVSGQVEVTDEEGSTCLWRG